MGAEVAVKDAHPVAWSERVCGADRDRLLTTAVVEGTGNLALLVERQAALLGRPHHRHEAEQARTVLTRQRFARLERGIRCRAHLAERHFSRPVGSVPASGSPPPGRFRDAGISGCRAYGRRSRGIFPVSHVRIATTILPVWPAFSNELGDPFDVHPCFKQ
jgi:hypothetical protein